MYADDLCTLSWSQRNKQRNAKILKRCWFASITVLRNGCYLPCIPMFLPWIIHPVEMLFLSHPSLFNNRLRIMNYHCFVSFKAGWICSHSRHSLISIWMLACHVRPPLPVSHGIHYTHCLLYPSILIPGFWESSQFLLSCICICWSVSM